MELWQLRFCNSAVGLFASVCYLINSAWLNVRFFAANVISVGMNIIAGIYVCRVNLTVFGSRVDVFGVITIFVGTNT